MGANEGGTGELDLSDCGQAKRRRLTGAQMMWSAKRPGDFDDVDDLGFGDDFGYASLFSGDGFSSFARNNKPPVQQ